MGNITILRTECITSPSKRCPLLNLRPLANVKTKIILSESNARPHFLHSQFIERIGSWRNLSKILLLIPKYQEVVRIISTYQPVTKRIKK
jgi:hypothetical protein